MPFWFVWFVRDLLRLDSNAAREDQSAAPVRRAEVEDGGEVERRVRVAVQVHVGGGVLAWAAFTSGASNISIHKLCLEVGKSFFC